VNYLAFTSAKYSCKKLNNSRPLITVSIKIASICWWIWRLALAVTKLIMNDCVSSWNHLSVLYSFVNQFILSLWLLLQKPPSVELDVLFKNCLKINLIAYFRYLSYFDEVKQLYYRVSLFLFTLFSLVCFLWPSLYVSKLSFLLTSLWGPLTC